MHLTIFTDYGLRSLMYLASQPHKLFSVSQIAEHHGISRNHLVKVVHRLAQLGYIRTKKGRGGGLELACDATTLKLGDLIKSLEPNMHLVECFDEKKNTCKITSSCKLKHILYQAYNAFIEGLNQSTLNDIIQVGDLSSYINLRIN